MTRSKVLGLFAKRVPLKFLLSDLSRKRLWANVSTHCNKSIHAVYFTVKVLFLQIFCEISAYLRNCLISGDYTYHAAWRRQRINPKVYSLSHFICFTQECMLIVTFETVRVNWRPSKWRLRFNGGRSRFTNLITNLINLEKRLLRYPVTMTS